MPRRLSILLPILLAGCVSAEPHAFTCSVGTPDSESRLADFMSPYRDPPQFAQIRMDACPSDHQLNNGQTLIECSDDAGAIVKSRIASGLATNGERAEPSPVVSNLDSDQDRAVKNLAEIFTRDARFDGTKPTALLLSGGGGWGAFGAGFLSAWKEHPDRPMPKLSVVTGISTGAIQGLFVATGNIPQLKEEYSINEQSDLATENSIRGLIRKGSLFRTEPLRRRLMGALCSPNGGGCEMLDELNDEDSPTLMVGMVEARSGVLQIVNVTDFVRQNYPATNEQKLDLANCVTAVIMASAAVPVQLQPVTIEADFNPQPQPSGDDVTRNRAARAFVDGGVRNSVFLDYVWRGVALAQEEAKDKNLPQNAPELYVIRNGPTVVAPDDWGDPNGDQSQADERPDALRIGERSYATIVNQNEVASIAMLRLIMPVEDVRLVTADGYNSSRRLEADRCGNSQNGMVFDPIFMGCLITWGQKKHDFPSQIFRRESPWIELQKVSGGPPP